MCEKGSVNDYEIVYRWRVCQLKAQEAGLRLTADNGAFVVNDGPDCRHATESVLNLMGFLDGFIGKPVKRKRKS